MRITITDVRRAGLCVAGASNWFVRHGFSRDEFREFLRDGLCADELRARGDGMVDLVLSRKTGGPPIE